jgi:mycothiol synthase
MRRTAGIDLVDDVSDRRDAIETLAARSAASEAAPALNEAGLLNLRHQRSGVRHLVALDGTDLVGYAQLAPGGSDEEVDTAALVVAPEARRHGLGRAMLNRVLDLAERPVQLWALGDAPAASALARSAGLEPVRALSVMTRSLDDEITEPAPPVGVSIRTFRPGVDEDPWLAVNARAFAHHPEQGRITRTDLAERMAEPWFDPAGFFLAERAGRLIGFHWTKEHADGLGEVYVIGVDPDAAGGGVGKALLYAGLRHLRARGNRLVELYVESDHTTAIALYRGAGFTEINRDVLYRQVAQ